MSDLPVPEERAEPEWRHDDEIEPTSGARGPPSNVVSPPPREGPDA
jgi:hypothetical protein